MKNLILQPRFQFKYTGMVVAVTVFVGGILGGYAYNYSRGQTELLMIHRMEAAIDRGEDVTNEFTVDLQRYAAAADRRVLLAIIAGVIALTLAVGATGIVITHRLVGPAHRLKLMCQRVAGGQWAGGGALRKHDELQDVFEAFQEMLEELRGDRRDELAMLGEALALAKAADHSQEELCQALTHLEARMARVLQDRTG